VKALEKVVFVMKDGKVYREAARSSRSPSS
jgi:hypothetical protein